MSHPCSLDFVTSPPPSPKNLKSGVSALPGGAKPELQQLKLGQLFWVSECVCVCNLNWRLHQRGDLKVSPADGETPASRVHISQPLTAGTGLLKGLEVQGRHGSLNN